ncbi:MAG TPA: PadR family transcriptional regulator [Candidatus Dormibacteraeota bacterium]
MTVKDGSGGTRQLALGPSAFLVLGYAARLGRVTPYQLKQLAKQGVSWFWDFPHSQLYVEPARLAKLGLLEEIVEGHGRRRKLYSLTEAGREVLRQWFDSPVHEQHEVRDLGLLKLVFAGLTDPARIRRLAEEQIALHRQRLAEYDLIISDWTSFSRLYPNQITVRMGQLHEQAYLTFWRSILDEPPAMDPRLESIYDENSTVVTARV